MELERRVRAWRREYLRGGILDGALSLACALVCALAVLLWSDRALSLGGAWRWAALSAAAAGVALAAHRWLAGPWLGFRWEIVLDAAQRLRPELKNHLKTAWELARGGPGPDCSERLAAAHLEATEALLKGLPADALFPWRPSRRARRWAAAAFVGGLTLPWAGGGRMERVLAPWRDVPLERWVEIAPGDASAAWGADARLTARFKDGAPASGRRELKLWIDGAPAPWDALTEDGARYTAEGLSAPLNYRLSWRDLESRSYRLTPVAVPELESLQARVHGAEAATVALTAAQPLEVLRGTLVTISGKPNQTLASARLRLSTLAAPIPMKAGTDGLYSASFIVQEDAALRFELESADGRSDPNPVSYALKATADMPPKIELVSPLEPTAASPKDSLPLSFSAADDGGLARITLLARAKGMPQREIPVKALDGRREFAGDFSWDLSGLPLGRVEFQLKAVDNAKPPQSALSAAGTVDIVDFAAGHAETADRWEKAERSVDELARRERNALAKLADGGPQLEAELAALPKSWNEASSALAQWSKAMDKDAYANPGLAEAARAAASAVDAARQSELPAALQASKSGDAARAKDLHERLAAKAEQAKRLLSEGRKLQGLQDFYGEAGRMAQAGADLQSALDAASGGRKPDPQTMAKLAEGLQKLQKSMEALQKTMQALPKADQNAAEAAARKTYELPLEQARAQADALTQALARGDFAKAAEIARQLSENLDKIQRALGDAASDASASGEARRSSERLSKAQSKWSELVEEQTKVLEKTESISRARLSKLMSAQKDLLAELAQKQSALVSSAAALGAPFPQDALTMMRSVSAELDARKISSAPLALKAASARLRMDPGRAWEKFAAAEDSVREALEKGAAAAPEAPDADSAAAGAAQSAARAKTQALRQELKAIDEETGAIPREALDGLDGAQKEQASAEGALGEGKASVAKPREEAALRLLSAGGQALDKAAGGAGASQSGMGQPFSRPGGGVFRVVPGGSGGSGSGASLGFVPLPSSREYTPPKELRDELKKSLEESRPSSYDPVIKEYFKRISQ